MTEQTSFGNVPVSPNRGESAESSEPGGDGFGEVAAVAGFRLLINHSPEACPDCKDSRVIEIPCISCCQGEAVEEIKEQLDFYAEWDRELGA